MSGTKLSSNDAPRAAGDIHASYSKYNLTIQDTTIENYKSKNSIYLDSVNFKATRMNMKSKFKNSLYFIGVRNENMNYSVAGGIYCFDCVSFILESSNI